MQDKFPTICAYIRNEIADMIMSGAIKLMNDYPDLCELRAKEVSAVLILQEYIKELEAWKALARSRALTSAQIDEFEYARMDQEDIDGGIHRLIERETGHRSIGIDLDILNTWGFDAGRLELGPYEPDWYNKRQSYLAQLRDERSKAKELAASEKEAEITYVETMCQIDTERATARIEYLLSELRDLEYAISAYSNSAMWKGALDVAKKRRTEIRAILGLDTE